MLTKRLTNALAALLLLVAQPFSTLAKQSPSQAVRADNSQSQANKDKTSRTTNEGAQHTPRSASEQATRLRRILPVLPSLIRGGDGLLSTEGQRATQSQLVTSTNVKDPVADAFSFTAGLPVETANPVQIPTEQFSVSLAKFYATIFGNYFDNVHHNGSRFEWNLTNHFNPRDVELDHGHSEETQDQLFLRGYFNGARRTYRASATFNF